MSGQVRWTFRPGWEQEIEALPGVHAGVLDAARILLGAAYQRAWPHRDTGNYVSELKVRDRGESGAAVVAEADYSNFLEYGTSSRRSPDAPTPTMSPEKTGVHPQFILTGAISDVSR